VWPVRALAPELAFGVVLFFTLSGFLLYRPFAASVLRGAPLPSVRRYLGNRALRIAPAYVAILLLVALVLGAAINRADGVLYSGRMTEPGLLARNVLLVQEYTPESLLTGITPTWSLAVEVAFYVALPALALLAFALARNAPSRRRRQMAALAPAVLLLVVGVSGKLAAAHGFPTGFNHGWNADWQSVVERSFWGQADLFVFGMALAVLHVEVEDGSIRTSHTLRRWAAPVGLLAFLAGALALDTPEQLGASFYNTLVAFALACLLGFVVLPTHRASPPLLLRLLETRPFVWAGLVSYSVFLWHEPLVHWLNDRDLTAAGAFGLALNTLVLATVTAALATATYRWVELPGLRRKRKPTQARALPAVPREELQAAP
jgi:peptidoglycan/LPS O-acetylase OafA/YrhL